MGIRAFSAALASGILAATSASAAVPGVTDTEVTIGITGPLSGPAAAWGTIALASEAYAKYVNDNGGVNGRKLKVVLKDDGYNPGRAVANVSEMKDQVFAILGTVGTAVLNAKLLPIIKEFLSSVEGALNAKGISGRILVFKGDGGLMTMDSARERPVDTVLSGPAASLVGGKVLSGQGSCIASVI